MSGKRRAPGPAVKRTPASPSSSNGTGGTPRSRGQKIWRVGRWFLAAGLVLALIGVGAFVYLYQTTDLPNPNKDFETQTSFVYYADGKTEVGKFATQNREIITLDEMPQTLQDAVVAAENQTFWTDKGIDPKGILRAAFSNASGNATQGASTITQQYVKILYLTQEQTLTRKLNEAILSLKLQNQVSKQEILQGYLNTIYFGHGAYGAQAAAQAYFDKDAKDLDLRESAFLATVLNNPTGYDPDVKANKEAILERYRYVLSSMVKTESITAEQADRAGKRLPDFPKIEQESTYGGQRGHMLRLVKDELHQLGFSDQRIDGGGLRVTTTFTPKAMKAAEEGVMEARPDGFSDKKLHIGVASVEPGTGALRGFYGGQDFLDSQINWAEAGGMVGSTVKPFTVATALEQGYSLKDTFQGNSPYEFPDGSTVNNEGFGPDGLGNDYGDSVSITQALEESINTAFVDMSSSMTNGPDKILHTMNEMGVPPSERDREYPGIPMTSRDLEADSRITLGKARISPINMANAYATVAANGQRSDVHVIEKVVDPSGETLFDWKQPAREGIDEDVAADTSYAMQQVVQSGTGQAALALGRPAAGKTGTATNDKDAVSSAWFVGYTPQLSTAVMYVRGDGDDQLDGWLPSYFGADYPADTWTAVMQRDMAGLPVEDFPPPANLDGDAPQEGHDPYTPPPPTTTQTTEPSTTTSAPTTKTPGPPSSSFTPPGQSSPTETDSCTLLSCPTSTDTSTPGPPSTPPGQQAQRSRRRRRRSRPTARRTSAG